MPDIVDSSVPVTNIDSNNISIKLDENVASELIKVDASIQGWSVKYAQINLESRGIESTIHNLHQHKAKLMSDALKEQGIDLSKYTSAHMGTDGTVQLISDNDGSINPPLNK
ncbi:MAG TPA: hypothetical protein ENI61_03285 [Ignavibacteria bacterium]|nr:hypothetical protein [Ignavibacteria bacterium]